MSSPQYSQDYVIDIKPEVGRISPSRITALERRMSPPKRISKERIADLERRLTPRAQASKMPSSSMTMVKPKRKYTKRTSSKKRSYKKRGSKRCSYKRSSKKGSKRRSSSCGRGYTSVRTYVRSDTKTRVSRHCSRIGKRRSKK